MSAPSLLDVARLALDARVRRCSSRRCASAALYGLGVRRAGRPLAAAAHRLVPRPGSRCVLVALQSGIDAYDDRLLSVHMVQHMLLLLVAPPLLLGGRPVMLALRALPPAPPELARPGRCTPRAAAHRPGSGARGLRRRGRAHASAGVLRRDAPAPALHYAEHALYLVAGPADVVAAARRRPGAAPPAERPRQARLPARGDARRWRSSAPT